MEKTGADFTNTFLAIEDTLRHSLSSDDLNNDQFNLKELSPHYLLAECSSLCDLLESLHTDCRM